ncbi:NlpC/P60 family protein [Brevundimonas sp.]|uniref:C40 family peptidase n=1 Tax=Brevundimonas sp. TaxID=1871086 RepID=UPI002487AE50|nr:NlpC/P60 family protein [Brevundimonas sp.]MDI1282710.1 NlpC/P60 family protein [Brevundimonas sp.]
MTVFAATLDPRTTLARPDLAEQALEGLVRAAAYRPVTPMQCVVAVAPVRTRAGSDGEQADQLVFGEGFDVLDRRDDQVWGRARRDGVVGWVDVATLSDTVILPTHRICTLISPVYPAATAAESTASLPLNALVTIGGSDHGRVEVPGVGWVAVRHLAALDRFDSDPGEAAERFVGTPFMPGGRTALGTNCSGLVQQALYACGLGGPRFRDGQSALGRPVEAATLRRGDLVVWDDHTGVMIDADRIVHATSHHGSVTVETLVEADGREQAAGSGAPFFRRVTL